MTSRPPPGECGCECGSACCDRAAKLGLATGVLMFVTLLSQALYAWGSVEIRERLHRLEGGVGSCLAR
jgi:hypothetical protein